MIQVDLAYPIENRDLVDTWLLVLTAACNGVIESSGAGWGLRDIQVNFGRLEDALKFVESVKSEIALEPNGYCDIVDPENFEEEDEDGEEHLAN